MRLVQLTDKGEESEGTPPIVVAATEQFLESIGLEGAESLRAEIAQKVLDGHMSYDRWRINYIYLYSINKDVFDYLFGDLKPTKTIQNS